MKTISNKDKISLGRGYGTEILNSVKKAEKSVKIVSPYLSASYLDELINLRKKGVEITLITSDNLTEQDSKYSFDNSKVIKQEKMINQEAKQKKKSLRTTSVIFFLIFLSTLALSYLYPLLIFLSILLFIITLIIFISSYFVKQYSYQYNSIFRLKVFDG